MTQLEFAQNEYVGIAAMVQAAGMEHARARVELMAAKASGDVERIAIAAMRSAYATKLWETRLREEGSVLRLYNEQLAQEVQQCRDEATQCATLSQERPVPVVTAVPPFFDDFVRDSFLI